MCFIRTWRNPRLRSIERAIQKNFIDSEADCCRVFLPFSPSFWGKNKTWRKNRNKYNLGSTRNRLSGPYCSGLFTISDKVVIGSIRMGWMCTVNNEGLMCTFVLYEIS